MNNNSISVCTVYRSFTSKKTFEKHVDVFLISDAEKFHNVLIKFFNRFMTNKTKHRGEKYFNA